MKVDVENDPLVLNSSSRKLWYLKKVVIGIVYRILHMKYGKLIVIGAIVHSDVQ